MPRNSKVITINCIKKPSEVPEEETERFISAIFNLPFKQALSMLRTMIFEDIKEDSATSTKQDTVFKTPKKRINNSCEC